VGGRDPTSAAAILEDAAVNLKQKWNLTFGVDSKCVMPACGGELEQDDFEQLEGHGWKVVSEMKCLGHVLASSGAIASDWADTINQMWRSYFANLQPAIMKAPARTRIGLVNRCTRPVGAFRWSRWPFQRTYAHRLDRV